MKRKFMTERRFDLLITWALLGFGVWYLVTMNAYPANAGRVPSIVAVVFLSAAVLQLGKLLRRSRRQDGTETTVETSRAEATAVATGEAKGSTELLPEVALTDTNSEPSPSGYDQLIALDSVRRKRLFTIAAYSIAFYWGMLLVGFVLTAGVLITALLLIARERLPVALAGGLLGAAGVYALVVFVLDAPALGGYVFG